MMLYRVCFLFFLFLVGVFYWRCAGENEKGGGGGASLSAQCVNNREPVQINEEFSNPVKVTINGYGGHAMEHFISRDGNYLFFNSLNDGEDTCLYYASRIDDATFNFLGKIAGVNGTPPHLDAIPSMDSEGRFYFISTRNYSRDYINLFSGNFLDGKVYDLDSQPGNFYIATTGWIIMDAEVSPDGATLYYVNAYFTGGSVPDKADIGIARLSGGNFNMDQNSAEILKKINTAGSLEYAPSISSDGLELFFTRLDPCATPSQIFLAKRNSLSEPFRSPERIGVLKGFVEAPSISYDKKTLYYHSRDATLYTIYKVSR